MSCVGLGNSRGEGAAGRAAVPLSTVRNREMPSHQEEEFQHVSFCSETMFPDLKHKVKVDMHRIPLHAYS